MPGIEFILEGDPLIPTDSPIDYMVGMDSIVDDNPPENTTEPVILPIKKKTQLADSKTHTSKSKGPTVDSILLPMSTILTVIDYTAVLFETYHYRHFTAPESRVMCLERKDRPTPMQWGAFIDRLIKNNVLSLVVRPRKRTLYRFNPPPNTCTFSLNFEYIMRTLMSNYIAIPIVPIPFTAVDSFSRFNGERRPLINDWNAYLDCLVVDGYLEVNNSSGVNYYRLCNKINCEPNDKYRHI